MSEKKYVNVTGIQNDPASLCMAEHLVATFINESAPVDPMVALGASVALQCFVDPRGVRAVIAKFGASEAVAAIAAQGKAEAEDIRSAEAVVERIASISQYYSDDVIEGMLPGMEVGSTSRVEMLRALESEFMGLAFKD